MVQTMACCLVGAKLLSEAILLNWTLGTNFSEILSEIDTFSFKQMRLKMSSGKWRPYCLGLNVVKKWLCYSGHRVALVVHRAQKSVPDLASEWPTFLPPPLESCSGTANVDGANWCDLYHYYPYLLHFVIQLQCFSCHIMYEWKYCTAKFVK